MAPPKQNPKADLERLEQFYGPQKLTGPSDPYEMIVYVNCGYPATDASCSRGFEALKREVGLEPVNILAAPKTKLAKLMRLGGIVPELRAKRLQEIARTVKKEFAGNLPVALKEKLQDERKQPGAGIRGAKKILQGFPVIGEPTAEKILLFSKLASVAAVPSASVHVPVRLWIGQPGKNYAADYRVAREILSAALDEAFEARQRAYLLLKKHGQEICKRSTPKCAICPLTARCVYFQAKAGDSNAE
jgi:endonuclease-3